MGVAERLTYLFYRYYDNACTPSEKEELFQLLLDPGNDALLRSLIEETWAKDAPSRLQDPQTADKILQYIIRQQPPVVLPAHNKFRFVKYAAAVFLLLSASFLAWYLYSSHTHTTIPAKTNGMAMMVNASAVVRISRSGFTSHQRLYQKV